MTEQLLIVGPQGMPIIEFWTYGAMFGKGISANTWSGMSKSSSPLKDDKARVSASWACWGEDITASLEVEAIACSGVVLSVFPVVSQETQTSASLSPQMYALNTFSKMTLLCCHWLSWYGD